MKFKNYGVSARCCARCSRRGGSSRKNLGGHGPRDKGEKGGLEAKPQQIFLTTPFFPYENVLF